ncbi:hypothetical protein CMEL01_02020 [Colletotrichum melonis]|uniref:Uncharacterized protein n=1 Tax=Colletotrichum melonis TaxID=1209925 RepID=A0AAI9UIL0_9PEZI|nr:hypothetical protein CMEL01_02020 [Colletotrichum melonis]
MLRRFRAVSEILSRMRVVGISLVCLSALRSTELGGVHGRLDGSGRRRTRGGIWAATCIFSSSACGGIDHGYRWTDRLTNEPPTRDPLSRRTQVDCGLLRESGVPGATHVATASNTGFTGRLTNGGQHRAHADRERRHSRETG